MKKKKQKVSNKKSQKVLWYAFCFVTLKRKTSAESTRYKFTNQH